MTRGPKARRRSGDIAGYAAPGRARPVAARAVALLVLGILLSSLLATPRRAGPPVTSPEISERPEAISETVAMRSITVDGRKFNYCANGPVSIDPSAFDRVIFVVHGNDRRACTVANAVQSAARMQGQTRTLIVAPWFPMTGDLASTERQLHWSFDGWSQGDPSVNTGPAISSFEVLDRLASYATKPRTLVGFSGGGQFVTRYATATGVPYKDVVVADPSTYLYFTPERPGTAPATLAACPDYNRYRYGLDGLNPYLARAGVRRLADRWLTQDVTYLLGEQDDDPQSFSMDKSCAAMAQGSNRLDRGERYYAYLKRTFGARLHHRLRRVPGVNHDAVAMFTSDLGRQALFPESGRSTRTWQQWLTGQQWP